MGVHSTFALIAILKVSLSIKKDARHQPVHFKLHSLYLPRYNTDRITTQREHKMVGMTRGVLD